MNFINALKQYIELSLSEISGSNNDFSKGQKYAYVEMLEMLQSSLSIREQTEINLDYNIEDIYPIE